MLELKESNSPFWLIGAGKYGTFSGSDTNIPCYYKSSKKQLELAEQILKNNDNVIDVFLLTGTAWDNMPSSNSKEELGYVKNKGRLILSKNQIIECDYPKGVSRDPLPKKGVKTYTSVATALEDKGDSKMSLELKDDILKEDIISVDDIPEDLQDRFFTALGDGRPEMFKKFSKDELKLFADFVKQLPDNEVTEFERSLALVAISLAHGDDFTVTENMDLTEQLQQPNEYCSEFKTGDVVKFIQPGDEESDETAIIVGYDDDGFYKVKWSDGKTSSGLHDKNLKLISKSDLKESKIVAPVGNPQTAGSFVNIDVDLDHMEISDFIARLAQAIRSEQTSVLEYVALRSANGITNEERTVIDQIIEEEKNHMVAITTLLYKQLLVNHQQNVDGANSEFVLPKFGMEIFDNSKEGTLKESIISTVNKIIIKEATYDANNDEFWIGDYDSGRVYKGLTDALNVVKNAISASGDDVIIRNITLGDNSLNENKKINMKESVKTLDELIKELETDTNYDEIACHINEYSKIDKKKASELMNKLFDLKTSKSPKECSAELIAMLTKNEDIDINLEGETMSQTQWDIVVDVNYDNDFYLQVLNNITNAIKELNPILVKDKHYAIAEDKYTLAENKFNFMLLTYNSFKDMVNENLIKELCEKLFERASNYEYFIELA